MIMDIIAIINQKGGVSKSTTAGAILAGLTLKGKKALAIDFDAQCNLSLITGASTQGLTIVDVLAGRAKLKDAVQHTGQGDIVAGHNSLAGADAEYTGRGKQFLLRDALKGAGYDYVIIDTNPALNILTINALATAKRVIIPTQADLLSLQGIKGLGETIEAVRATVNPSLKIEGILLARYNPRSIYTAELTELIERQAGAMGTKVFDSKIREAIAIKEAQIQQLSIYQYAPRAKVTADYKGLIDELLKG